MKNTFIEIFEAIRKSTPLKNVRKTLILLCLFAIVGILYLIWSSYPSETAEYTAEVMRIIDKNDNAKKLERLRLLSQGGELEIPSALGLSSYKIKPLNTKFNDEYSLGSKLYKLNSFGVIVVDHNTVIRVPSNDTILGLNNYRIGEHIANDIDKSALYFHCLDDKGQKGILRIGKISTNTFYYKSAAKQEQVFGISSYYIYTISGEDQFNKSTICRYKLFHDPVIMKQSGDTQDTIYNSTDDESIRYMSAATYGNVETILAVTGSKKIFQPTNAFKIHYWLGDFNNNHEVIPVTIDNQGLLYCKFSFIYPYLYYSNSYEIDKIFRKNIWGDQQTDVLQIPSKYGITDFYVHNDSTISVFSYSFSKLIIVYKWPTGGNEQKEIFKSDSIQYAPGYYNFYEHGLGYYTQIEDKYIFNYLSFDKNNIIAIKINEQYSGIRAFCTPKGEINIYGTIGNELGVVNISSSHNGIFEKLIYSSWPQYPFSAHREYNWAIFILFALLGIVLFVIIVMILRERQRKYSLSNLAIIANFPTLNNQAALLESEGEKLKLRSDTMLILGMIIAVAGLAGYFLLTMNSDSQASSTNGVAIFSWTTFFRPFVLMTFCETIAFFFLRQYRVAFSEYKELFSAVMQMQKQIQLLEISVHEGLSPDTQQQASIDFLYNMSKYSFNFSPQKSDHRIIDKTMNEVISEFRKISEQLKPK